MSNDKILSQAKLGQIIKKLKIKNKKVVFTNGCFDILHYGHITYLKKAKSQGDILIIGVNSDSSVRKIKGRGRPINNQKARLAVLSGLKFIDYLVLFNESTPLNLIKQVKPNVLIKGADWQTKDIVGSELVRKSGGKVVRIPYVKGFSTTAIIEKIKRFS